MVLYKDVDGEQHEPFETVDLTLPEEFAVRTCWPWIRTNHEELGNAPASPLVSIPNVLRLPQGVAIDLLSMRKGTMLDMGTPSAEGMQTLQFEVCLYRVHASATGSRGSEAYASWMFRSYDVGAVERHVQREVEDAERYKRSCRYDEHLCWLQAICRRLRRARSREPLEPWAGNDHRLRP